MNLEVEELSSTKRRLKVEIPADAVDDALGSAYRELGRTAKIDGFRRGKAPRHILEKWYGESVNSDVVQKLVPEFYIKAVEESKLRPVANPSIEEAGLKIRKGQPLRFSATVEVQPEFELADYTGIEVDDEKPEVTDEDINAAVEEMRDMHSTLEAIEEDRPAKTGDFVVIDFEGFVDGEAFDGGKAENYTLELGSGRFIEGFEDQVAGAGKGDDLEVKVKFPDAYRNEKLAGREATFKVKVKELKSKLLPELDDEFAKDLGLGDTVEELRKKTSEDILKAKEQELYSRRKSQIIKALAERNKFDVPLSLVDSEYRSMMMRQYQDIVNSGMTPQQYGFDPKDFEQRFRPVAEERVRTSMVISAIAEKEGIDITDAELEAFLEKISAETGHSVREIKEMYKKREGGMEELRIAAEEDRVMELLLSKSVKKKAK